MKRARKHLPPIRSWAEAIDEQIVVGCAMMQEVKRRRVWVTGSGYGMQRSLYALAAFALVDRSAGWYWRAAETATQRLAELVAQRGGQLEYVGPADGPDPD